MLSGTHFYHRTIRSLVTVFGTLFNNVRLVRYNNQGTVEIERVNVPISYASKEKFYKRLSEDPVIENQTQINLPRFAFEVAGFSFDPLRKFSTYNNIFYKIPSNLVNRVRLVPYNLEFNLHLFVRNIEEGFQIVEQIAGTFDPDYTVTMDFIEPGSIKLDVPIVLNSITYDDSYDGDIESTRVLSWTLSFSVKAYFLTITEQSKLITDAYGNVYSLSSDVFEFTSGNGAEYQLNELVYQGNSVDEATAVGYVKSWNNSTNTISLVDVNGEFVANSIFTGATSSAKYSYDTPKDKNQIFRILVEPYPLDADIEDNFSYTANVSYE